VTPDTHDYTALSNEQLSELIYRLSVESRNRYETSVELAKIMRDTFREKVAKPFEELAKEAEEYEARGNIDAKASLASGATIAVNGSSSPVEANPDGE
jgi:hypothetical protein